MASFQYDHNLWPEDDTNPWDAELSVTPRISSYNYGSPTVAVSVSGSSDRSDKTTPTETAHTLGWDTWGCYRIQNVPFTWTKSKLHLTLQKFESLGDIEESELSLFSTSPRSLIKTALLHREKCPECFRSLTTGRSHLLEVEEPAGERHFLSVDYEFYGLTPLNEPEGENIVDVIAVTCLAGHAYGSWTNTRTRHMWLKDFLPREHKNIRVLTYGYNTKLSGEGKVDFSLVDHKNTFIQQLENVRVSEEERKRPIIFIGHGFGGILILQGLVESQYGLQSDIVNSTHGLLLFSVPLLGLNGTEELQAMVDDMSSEELSTQHELISCIKRDSTYLNTLNPNIKDLCLKLQLQIFSYYERLPTAIAQKNSITGIWGRTGREVISVDRFSAVMSLPNEKRYPIPLNHAEMVRFETMGDNNYRTVSAHVAECLWRISRMYGKKRVTQNDHANESKPLETWNIVPQNSTCMPEEAGAIRTIHGHHTSQTGEISSLVLMELPSRKNSNFTGRKKGLAKIHNLLGSTDPDFSH